MSRTGRCRCQSYGSYGSYAGISAYGGERLGISFLGEDRREQAVKDQISAALGKRWLSGYLAAENTSLFQTAPTSELEAYVTAAYWMAVAARVSGSSSLAVEADKLFAKRLWAFGLWSSPEGIAAILADAVNTIEKKAGRTDPNIRGILAQLGEQSEIEAVRAARAEESGGSWIPDIAYRGGEEGPIAKLRLLYYGVTGDRPPEIPAWKWNLGKAAIGLGILALVGGVLYIYTAPMRRAARTARGG